MSVLFEEDAEKPEKIKKTLKQKIVGVNWIGKIEEFVESKVSFRGEPIKDPEIACPKCGANVDLNNQIDVEGGVHLARIRLGMNDLAKWRQKFEELEKKRKAKNIDLYRYKLEHEKLLNEHARFIKERSVGSTHTTELPIVCTNCSVPLGKASVHLRLTVPELKSEALKFEDLYALGMPNKIAARVAFELGYPNPDTLKRWTENPDLERAREFIEEFKEKFSGLNVPDELFYDLGKQLNSLPDAIVKEKRRRMQVVVEAVEEIAKTDAIGR